MLFWIRVSCLPDCPRTQYINRDDFELLVLLSWVLGSQLCTTMPSFIGCWESNPGLCACQAHPQPEDECSSVGALMPFFGSTCALLWEHLRPSVGTLMPCSCCFLLMRRPSTGVTPHGFPLPMPLFLPDPSMRNTFGRGLWVCPAHPLSPC